MAGVEESHRRGKERVSIPRGGGEEEKVGEKTEGEEGEVGRRRRIVSQRRRNPRVERALPRGRGEEEKVEEVTEWAEGKQGGGGEY